ncbi:hypothetical protein TWF506_010844 [Arthrobotrys conoides]
MPPNAPMNSNMSGTPPHPRRDSGHGDGPPPAGISHGRGMPQGNHRGRNQHQMGGNFNNQYPPHNNPTPFASPGYSNTPQYRAGPNQQRGGATGPVGSPYQTPAHMATYNNNRGGRSPALTHSLPSTPQMNNAQLAGNPNMQHSPHMNYQHLSPHPHQIQPMQPMYTQDFGQAAYYGQHQQHYIPYPQPPFIPPGSPRAGYMPQQPQQGGYMPPPFQSGQSSSMARTASQPSDHHIGRPPSGMSHMPHSSPLTSANIPPPLSHPGPTAPVPNIPNNQFFKKVEKTSKKIEIRDPNTGTVKTFSNLPPPPPISGRSPVIVSSSPAPENAAHIRIEAKPAPAVPKPSNAKTIQEVRDEIKATVYREIQVKKQQEEDELRQKKEEEERKAKEAADAELKRLKLEEEERIQKERELKEKELKEREQKEKEEAERKAAEEKEAAEAAATKAKAEAAAEEERLRLEREKEAAEEAQRQEQAEEAEKQRLAAEAEESRKQEAAALEARRAEDLRKTGSPAASASTPAGPGDEDADAKAVAAAIKGSTSLPPDSKEAESFASDITKITVNAHATPSEILQNPPAPKSNQRKPAPLNLQLKTSSEPALPSAALTALRSARFIDDINKVAYPPSIISPNPALNANAPNGKFKYEKDFLMQFQTVFTDKPSTDWEQRMRDTVGEPDSARPMGGSRAPSSAGPGKTRSALPGPPPSMGMGMGTFRVGGGVGGSVMPPSGRQSSNSPFPIGVPRPFPARNHSSTQLSGQGSAPQSPGGPKGSQRSGSKNIPRRGGMDGKRPSQGGTSKAELESVNPPPAPPPADFEPLKATASAWKPRTAGGAAASSSLSNQISASASASASGTAPSDESRLSPEMVQRKVKAALNKMTPEKFDKIADQILEIASQSRYETDGRSLRQVIQLTFEKATDEPNFSSMYAKFCKRMLESMHPDIKDENIKDKNGNIVTGGALFRKYLLNRCQEEFERGWKVNLPPKPEGVSEEAALMSDEYYVAAAAKRRGLGLIQFIGELFKLQMLTERIMHECVKKLVDYEGTPEEEEVESLCKLLRTIGYALDATDKSRLAMDAYFNRIQQMMDSKELNSRMKFMLLDVVELRKVNWESKEADKGPKTIAEIREEAQKAQLEKEAAAARDKQRQRSQAGRGDGRSFSQGGYGGNQGFQDQRQNQTLGTDELRRLGGIKPLRQATGGSFGPSAGLFGRSGSSSGSRKGLGGLGAPSNLQPGADSGVSSRTATPPVTRDSVASTNSFSLLSSHQDGADNSEPHETSGPNDTGSTNESKLQNADS